MLKFIDSLSLTPIILIAVLLGASPLGGQPHLLEKLSMLFTGTLSKPIDIFDLLMHGTPVIILIIKLWRMASSKKQSEKT